MDLMVVALKYGSLEGALESIQKATGEHTAIMSLMNGIDSEEIIGRTVGMEHVLPALIKVASHKEEDGYHFDPPTTLGIIFGEPSAPFDSERVKAVEELFADTGIHFRSTEYIQEEIWCKFCLNVCSNLPQAILDAVSVQVGGAAVQNRFVNVIDAAATVTSTNPNYFIDPAQVSVRIAQRPLTITAGQDTKQYDETPLSVDYTANAATYNGAVVTNATGLLLLPFTIVLPPLATLLLSNRSRFSTEMPCCFIHTALL